MTDSHGGWGGAGGRTPGLLSPRPPRGHRPRQTARDRFRASKRSHGQQQPGSAAREARAGPPPPRVSSRATPRGVAARAGQDAAGGEWRAGGRAAYMAGAAGRGLGRGSDGGGGSRWLRLALAARDWKMAAARHPHPGTAAGAGRGRRHVAGGPRGRGAAGPGVRPVGSVCRPEPGGPGSHTHPPPAPRASATRPPGTHTSPLDPISRRIPRSGSSGPDRTQPKVSPCNPVPSPGDPPSAPGKGGGWEMRSDHQGRCQGDADDAWNPDAGWRGTERTDLTRHPAN